MCNYRLRWFWSKKAFLILLWTAAVSFSMAVTLSELQHTIANSVGSYLWLVMMFIIMVSILSAIVSGWSADAKLGNYRVVKSGLILTFIAFTLVCVEDLLIQYISSQRAVIIIVVTVIGCLMSTGAITVLNNSIQLGLDQMPEASPTRITSFITWYMFSVISGFWAGSCLGTVKKWCITSSLHEVYIQIFSLVPVTITGLALVSSFIFAEKWLIIEPRVPQSMRTIYQVIKFAIKHKAPLDRSALTFWEEDIPSRLDLGKSKYGGPFTTEQVEDVKTVLRLTALVFSLSTVAASIGMLPKGDLIPLLRYLKWDDCTHEVVFHWIIKSMELQLIVWTFIYEFVIYPIAGSRLSILKRIGVSSMVITLGTGLLLVTTILNYKTWPNDELFIIPNILYSLTNSICMQILIVSTVEFVCAQSPYNMRSLFVGCATMLILLSYAINGFTGKLFHVFCDGDITNGKCMVIITSVKTLVSLLAFILHCVMARWYKLRVRSEDYEPQRVVEEIYDRYFSSPNYY